MANLTPDEQPTVLRPAQEPHAQPPESAASASPELPPAPTLAAPSAFGRYRVVRPLGMGGFGTVYLCEDVDLGRQVAIKVNRRGATASPSEMESFMEEARRLARLSHPGIVTIYDVGTQEGNVFVVSAYLEGMDLGRWLKANRPTWLESARIAAALADALAHAHSRLIIHRDVKPSNIILNASLEPILVDFGLALDEVQAGGREKGVFSGTPSYMSPEQATGMAHRIDGRTDIYGLGVVLYEMLTGHLPFRGRSVDEIVRQLREDEPQPLRQIVREIPPELERICLKALAKLQQDRYSTAADFGDELRRIITSATEPPTTRQPLSDFWNTGTALGSSRRSGSSSGSTRRRAREAERRQVTLLVCACDSFSSEQYLENLDTEDQSAVLRAFQHACEEAISHYEGTVLQCNEHGVLACFGYPVAFENAARRAARAGFGILHRIKALDQRLRKEHRLEMNVWCGIHTGIAVLETGDTAISLVGEARNTVLRLSEFATLGELLCTDNTRQLIESRFQCTSLGLKQVKGLTHPVEFFRVDGAIAVASALQAAAPETLSPLTGRDHEMSLLRDRWAQARNGECQVVLLMGEPGLGKSRLVLAMKEHVEGPAAPQAATNDSPPATSRTPLSIIEWRCSPHFTTTSLYPAGRAFERLLGFTDEHSLTVRFEKLVEHLGEYGLDRPDLVPLFAALLSLPLDRRFPPLKLSPVREREETFHALEHWLSALSNRRPILFICEDLHWADASTLEFVGRMVSDGTSDAILTLLTARSEFRAPWPVAPHQTSLALHRLTRDQVQDLMQKKSGNLMPAAVVDQVYQRAGGVPLFVEEFIKVVDPSTAAHSGEAGHAVPVSREIPATLLDLIMARVDRIEGDREVAQLAAVLGHEFNHDLVSAVANLDASSLEAEMRQLVQAEIIHQRGRAPHCLYTFKHALLQDALYNSLVKSKRQQLHRRVAEVLEAEFGMLLIETRPELLAHHFTEAGLTERGIHYWQQAGWRSRERSAEHEAIAHFKRGLALVAELPESPERDTIELELLGPLGTAYIAALGYAAPEVGPIFERARELCERAGEPPQWLAMLLGIWEWHTVRADLQLCVALAEEGVEFATRLNDPGMLMEASFMAGETMLYRGEFAPAHRCFANAIENYDDRERTSQWSDYTGHDAGVTHRSNLAITLWHLGFPDQALKVNEEMRALAREIAHPFSLAYALHHTAWLCQYLRLGAEAQAAAEEEIEIANAQGFALWQSTGTFYQGAGILLQGDRPKGVAHLLEGLASFRVSGAQLSLTCQLGIVGDACTQFKRFRDAHQALDEAIGLVTKNDERCQEAELYRLKGELILEEGAEPESLAETYFQRAIETAKSQQSKAWTLRASMSLARLWKRQGRGSEARQVLAEIYNTFTEGFTTPDLVDAKALLDELA